MRWLVYGDLDAFYVSCELLDRPDLRGHPVIVGPDPSRGPTRGVVLSASYEARARGVHSAQPAAQAARACPEATWIAADFGKYERYSRRVRGFLEERGFHPVPFSIDETAFEFDAPSASEVERRARLLQEEVKRELGLPISFGVAPFLSVAKIACDQAKPAGIRVVAEEEVAAFLQPLPMRAVPGVGPKTEEFLRGHGIERIGDLRDGAPTAVRLRMGAFAEELVRLARGAPTDRGLPTYAGPRSRSTDRTFPRDEGELAPLQSAVRTAARELAESLARERLRYQTVTVAIRWTDFARVQHSRTLPLPSTGEEPLVTAASRLSGELWSGEQSGRARPARAISVRVERLSELPGQQRALEEFAG